jgi:2-methylisocitrate lyase-like PEP mutase family enzyme
MNRHEQAAAAFAALHRKESGFVMPNAWDAGSVMSAVSMLACAGLPTSEAAMAISGPAFNASMTAEALTSRKLAMSLKLTPRHREVATKQSRIVPRIDSRIASLRSQ